MKIDLHRISTDFSGETCLTHARGAVAPDGFGIITTQPLRLSGSDIFYGMQMLRSTDGGATWSAPTPCKNLVRKPIGDGYEVAICDATPIYHKKSGKIILIGYMNTYLNDGPAPYGTRNATAYAVYDRELGDFGELRRLELPDTLGEDYYFCANGCGQCVELEDGDLLVPVTHYPRESEGLPRRDIRMSVAVLRCSFDGERLEFCEVGGSLRCDDERGACEGSLISYGGRFYLCIRNDLRGYVTVGDGLHFEEMRPLVFDDGSELGSYNTQQHWLTLSDGLYIVYTRRGAGNDHVFRHRAPLFIAKFDTARMCVLRETEMIAVPERGARLGNFGCVSLDGSRALVIASEWMQSTPPDCTNWRRCAEYGSDNSIFIASVS